MVEDADGNMNPQAESTLDKMARGMPEDTDAQEDIQSSPSGEAQEEGDALQLIGGKMNEMATDITEDTGGHGDIHLHAERKMNEMAKEMFED